MAVYTTELRTLLESMCGRTEHVGFDGIDGVVAETWRELFGTGWAIYDEAYREVLCGKIIKHYWMREIGAEVPGLFIHWLRTRMGEIMPYYNELYKSAMLDFNPLHDYELTTTSTRTNDGTTTETASSTAHSENVTETENTNESEHRGSSSGQSISKFSDTPQGSLDGVLDGTYLTNANVDDNTGSSTRNETGSSTGKATASGDTSGSTEGSSTVKSTEEYLLTVKGKSGGQSYSKLLTDYRATLLNIDEQIIDRLSDLFMGLWA